MPMKSKIRDNCQRVSIITLNWNGWKDTIECLESLYQITYQNYNVIVVDNNSEDDSINKINEYCEGNIEFESKFIEYSRDNKPIKIMEYTREEAEAGGCKEEEHENSASNKKLIVIKNEDNYGFARGNNIGILYALKTLNSEYILLLNNDTVVDHEFLTELIKGFKAENNVGICAPKIYLYDDPKKMGYAGRFINYWTGNTYDRAARQGQVDHGQFEDVIEVDYASGCCMLISRDVLLSVGLLDESFFFGGGEDVDICTRAARKGFKILFAPKSKLWHKGSVLRLNKTRSKRYSYYIVRNRFILMEKHCNKLQFITSSLCFIVYLPKFFVRYLRYYDRGWDTLRSFISGFWDYLRRR